MINTLRQHWPEYLMEAAGLGIFMISAALFTALMEHPDSPVRQAINDPFLRRIPIGIAMGFTAVGIIYSPWGKQSGAHINPAVTLTFYRLGKIQSWDAFFYIIFQFIGGLTGVILATFILGKTIANPAVNYVVTVPGTAGLVVAFVAEAFMSFVLMFTVLLTTNRVNWAVFTGLFAGILVGIFIILEAPYSGMSINPARSFGSALPAKIWTAFWLYLTAPPVGMLLAAEIYIRTKGFSAVYCAKFHHHNNKRCIFHCRYEEMVAENRRQDVNQTL